MLKKAKIFNISAGICQKNRLLGHGGALVMKICFYRQRKTEGTDVRVI